MAGLKSSVSSRIRMGIDPQHARSILREARKPLDASVATIQEQISLLETEILRRRLHRHHSELAAAIAQSSDALRHRLENTSAAAGYGRAQPIETIRERRMSADSSLVVDLDASAEASAGPSQSDTAFFSPSCHDWKFEHLMESPYWTPHASPRRSATDEGQPRWPVQPPVVNVQRRGG